MDAVAHISQPQALQVLRILVGYRSKVARDRAEDYHEAAFDAWTEYCTGMMWRHDETPVTYAAYIVKDSGLDRYFEEGYTR